MKKLMLASAVLFSILFASTSYAQLTGPSFLNVARADFGHIGYTVEPTSNGLTMKDATGNEIFTVSQVNPQTITLHSVVASLQNISPEKRAITLRKIALFNFSSPVGTLWFDNVTGEITMEHHLNPRLVSTSAMVNVASSFGTLARTEGQILMQ